MCKLCIYVECLYTRRTIKNKEPKIMLSLYKTLVRPHVEYCSSAWSPLYKKDKELIERIQHRFSKMVNNLGSKTYEERINVLGLCTLEAVSYTHLTLPTIYSV